jgi:hypothetical protein
LIGPMPGISTGFACSNPALIARARCKSSSPRLSAGAWLRRFSRA